jgi:hypothetical protein
MVKPQAQSLVLGAAIFLLIKELSEGKFINTVRYFLGLSLPYLLFSLYFKAHGHSILYLSQRLREVKDIFPVLVGSEVNIWHPISRVIQELTNHQGPIYDTPLSKLSVEILLYLTIIIMSWIIAKAAWQKRSTMTDVYTIASILLPQIVVMAHANHFYNASLLLFFYIFKSPRIKFLWFLSLLIHLYSIVARYGLGLGVPNFFKLNYEPMLTILAVVQFLIVIPLIKEIINNSKVNTKLSFK